METIEFDGRWFSYQTYTGYHLMRYIIRRNWQVYQTMYAFRYF